MILDEVLHEVYIPNVPATEKMVSEFAKMAKVEVSKDPQKVKALIKELRDTFKEFTNANRVEVEMIWVAVSLYHHSIILLQSLL